MRSATVRIAAVVAAVLAAGLVAACGGSDEHTQGDQQSTQRADHNADDVAFVRAMITHHGQAVQMAQMVPTNSDSRELIDLANRMTITQIGESQAFNAWLVQWPEGQTSGPAGHDAAGHGATMPGMVDAATMARLQSLTGAEFDRLWLASMIDHHRGAIAMAQDEVAHGKNPDVIYLAKAIIAGQQAEIDQMKQILGG